MFLHLKTECKTNLNPITLLHLNATQYFKCFINVVTDILCISFLCFLFLLGKCQKEQRSLELLFRIWLHFGITKGTLKEDLMCGASQQRPGTNCHHHQTTGRLHAPQIPPLSNRGNKNELLWRLEPFLEFDWEASFSPFPCHSTS